MGNGYDHNSYHDSHCEGPYCNCDERRYGYHSSGSDLVGAVCVILALVALLAFPPLGFIYFMHGHSPGKRPGRSIVGNIMIGKAHG